MDFFQIMYHRDINELKKVTVTLNKKEEWAKNFSQQYDSCHVHPLHIVSGLLCLDPDEPGERWEHGVFVHTIKSLNERLS